MDILKENGFDYSYEEYKKEFIKYITYEDNILDIDIKDIVFKVFGDITEYFDENDFGYPYIEMLHNDIQQVEELNDELNEYKLIKECLFNETLICDNFVNPNYLRKYLQIKEDYVSENKKLEQLSFVSLKKTEKDLNNRTNLLEQNVKKLTRDVEEINDSVDAVLSSKSWMITESLRTLKRLYKKVKRSSVMVKVSVIIPVYNVERYVCDCLDSIINQTLKDIEIICINDGSTDNSLKILKNML